MKSLACSLLVVAAVMAMTVGTLFAQADNAAPATAPAPAAAEAEPEMPKDPQRVLLTLDGQEFKAWMAQTMIEHRAAPDELSAANMWVDIQLKAAEARQRALDKDPKNEFIINLYRDYFLSGAILGAAIDKDIPAVADEELKKFYDSNLDRYKRPFNANVKHITVRERQLADDILVKAKAPEAKFEELVTAFSKANDKERKGQIRGGMPVLEKQLGKTAAQAIAQAKNGDILGPFVGTQGFEIVLVDQVTPDSIVPYEKVKDGIVEEMKAKAAREKNEQLLTQLKEKAQIVKSDELKDAENKLQEQQKKQEEQMKQQQQPAPPKN